MARSSCFDPSMINPVSKAIAVAASTLACLTPLSPVSAQNEVEEYGKVGGWTVSETIIETCRLTWSERDDVKLTITRGGGEVGYLGLRVTGSSRPQRPGVVTFAFDDEIVRGALLGGNYYTPSAPDEQVIAFFRSANTMQLRVDGEARFSFSLKGSNAAYAMLSECASRWPESRVPLVPPPPPSNYLQREIPDPNLAGPFAANREVAPIRSDLWFPKGQIPIYADDTGSTTIGVVIAVSGSGKPTQCEVSEPSDVKAINERACGIIMERAKFNPATDAQGTAIASRYTTQITF
ncbi:energy transducer TonB [Erythrobacter longus]|nr:energy transducer TonB [Erythrobacter longus]